MPSALQMFGKKIRELRKARKLSQEKLAELSAVHRNYIGTLERGKNPPCFEHILRVAMGLKVRPSELFKGLQVPKPGDFPQPKREAKEK